MTQEIHIHRRGDQIGPYSQEQVQEMLRTGMLDHHDLYWVEGKDQWEQVGGMAGLSAQSPVPPTIPLAPSRSHSISGEHPGFWLRFAAHFIDSIITYVAAFIAGFMIGFFLAIGGETDEDILGFFGMIGGFIAGWLYYALMESSKAQATLGKMACGFIVTDMEGKRISFGKASGRYFGRILSTLILFIGFMMCAFTEKKQCLHDMLAGCLMYRKQ